MATWPATLPHTPLAGGFSFEPIDQCVSSQMDSGPPKRRRRYSVAYGVYPLRFLLDGTQRATFQTWYGTTISSGADAFTGLPDPTDGTAATFQFAGPPRWECIRPNGSLTSRRWILSVTLERTA